MRLFLVLASAAALAACTTASDGPVASSAPARVEAAPVTPVTASALPPVGATAAAPVATTSMSGTMAMRRAPGARESAGLSNVSQVSRGGATSGTALGGTIVSGQTASAIPSVIDRNRTLPARRSATPTDPLGPGTAPPIVAPELRDTTGNTLRNRQRVEF
ncbi:hypothetical protein [Phreatobacter stygius]|uniref:DUF3035 domain-containing protein n=1 Tax=Phreatobacter stygius TaxID=1940610 RepID=A0A4D7B714_9HYPH|nr:hypothetical protein [Phreatobacter stygius]QCI68751.1 hypothetical protein E8M01_33685 [Phreatobacter stygius]